MWTASLNFALFMHIIPNTWFWLLMVWMKLCLKTLFRLAPSPCTTALMSSQSLDQYILGFFFSWAFVSGILRGYYYQHPTPLTVVNYSTVTVYERNFIFGKCTTLFSSLVTVFLVYFFSKWPGNHSKHLIFLK